VTAKALPNGKFATVANRATKAKGIKGGENNMIEKHTREGEKREGKVKANRLTGPSTVGKMYNHSCHRKITGKKKKIKREKRENKEMLQGTDILLSQSAGQIAFEDQT